MDLIELVNGLQLFVVFLCGGVVGGVAGVFGMALVTAGRECQEATDQELARRVVKGALERA